MIHQTTDKSKPDVSGTQAVECFSSARLLLLSTLLLHGVQVQTLEVKRVSFKSFAAKGFKILN